MLLDGKLVAQSTEKKAQQEIKTLHRKPLLAVVLLGENKASELYVKKKKEACLRVGIECIIHHFPESMSQEELLARIDELNSEDRVSGILIQLPLPKQMHTRVVLDAVAVHKDVDGLHSQHLLKILLNEEEILPCTPKGILNLLEYYKISLTGKSVCIIGFSDVVGKPLSILCLNRRATVTVCTSKTADLGSHTREADVIMTATGVPNLIQASMVKQGAIVIDIGINEFEGKTVGDVAFLQVEPKCSYITPVPGGVGPMTIAALIENLLSLAKQQP